MCGTPVGWIPEKITCREAEPELKDLAVEGSRILLPVGSDRLGLDRKMPRS